jgi:mediator of RNA polymerase II transcription subunit 6
MAQSSGTPLDEIQWREPEAVKFYGGIGAENVHLYFMQSPFCDPTSNNKVLELQARFNADLYPMLASRDEFEKRLKAMSGVEYLVVAGPSKTQPGMNPVWVIRKQRRTKVRGSSDEVDVLGTYFAIGENVYQAPSVLDIITCRLVSRPFEAAEPLLRVADDAYARSAESPWQCGRHAILRAE